MISNKVNVIDMKTKYNALLILHALGDTIGFKNGDWEFNYYDKSTTLEYVNELIYEFIALGGVNGINLRDWRVSDDTFFHIAICKSLLHYDVNNDTNNILYLKKYLTMEEERMDSERDGSYIDDNGKSISINMRIYKSY